MSDAKCGRCRSCAHWHPFFSGEPWNVRSFVDAPEGEKQRVLTFIREHFDRENFVDPSDLYGSGLPEPGEASVSRYGPTQQRLDWPLWGQCKLTELSEDPAIDTLAMAVDGSDYMAVLRCRHDFGCVQYAPVIDQEATAHT